MGHQDSARELECGERKGEAGTPSVGHLGCSTLMSYEHVGHTFHLISLNLHNSAKEISPPQFHV